MKRLGLGAAALAVVLAACSDSGPASFTYVGFSPAQPKLGDIVTVEFAALDSRGVPAEGIPVTFEIQNKDTAQGVKLQPTESSTTKGEGKVTTQIIATARPASVVVVATAGDKTAISPPIAIAGSFVSNRGITFQCGHIAGTSAAIHAINAYGPGRDLIAGTTVPCTAHVSDRNGNGIAGASVTFLTEAGAIGPSATSVTDAVGNADVTHKTSLPLPVEVQPGTYKHINPDPTSPEYDTVHIPQPLAPDWMEPWMWTKNPMDVNTYPARDPSCPSGCEEPRRADPVRPGHTNNPRDNLVSMIAVTAGEEAFIDTNNNGQFDPGTETFVDSTEPFVDANDNGTWDPGELYVDTNGNGSWTGKNGEYDGSTLIWAQERILWTGIPDPYDVQGKGPQPAPAEYLPTVAQVFPPAGGADDVAHVGCVHIGFRAADPWFNVFAQNDDQDGCHASSTENVTVFPDVFGAGGVRLTYPAVIQAEFAVCDAHQPTDPEFAAPGADWLVTPSCKLHSTIADRQPYAVEVGLIDLGAKVR